MPAADPSWAVEQQRWLLLTWFFLCEWLRPQRRSPVTSDRLRKRPLSISRGWVSGSVGSAHPTAKGKQCNLMTYRATRSVQSTESCVFFMGAYERTRRLCRSRTEIDDHEDYFLQKCLRRLKKNIENIQKWSLTSYKWNLFVPNYMTLSKWLGHVHQAYDPMIHFFFTFPKMFAKLLWTHLVSS